jgi:hypothetical protein
MCKYAEVLLVWRWSHFSKIFSDLEVSYIGFIDIARAGVLNPAFSLQGYVTEYPFTVTALLIDRSLSNSGLRRNNFFVMCIELQHFVIALWDVDVRLLENLRSIVACGYINVDVSSIG